MKFNITHWAAIGLGLAVFTTQAQTGPEYAKFDPATRTWELHFQQQSAEDDAVADWQTFRYEVRGDIQPSIRSVISPQGGEFSYRYRVSNHRSARQLINYFYTWTAILPLPPRKPPPPAAELNANPQTMRAWQLQGDERRATQRATQNAALSEPAGWRRAMSFDADVTGYGWFPTIEPYGPGVPPGQSAGGFEIRRPELPGATYAKMQGRVEEPGLPTGYKPGGPVEQAIREIISTDQVYVPILAPAITLPMPYSTAEHARRLRAHAQTWLGDATHSPMVSMLVLGNLGRQFDTLIPALERGNKAAARAAVTEMLREVFSHNPGLNPLKLSEDEENQAAGALPQRAASRTGMQQVPRNMPLTIDRVAARALAFNLQYLLTRMESGR